MTAAGIAIVLRGPVDSGPAQNASLDPGTRGMGRTWGSPRLCRSERTLDA